MFLVPARFSCLSTTARIKELEPKPGSTFHGGAMKLSTPYEKMRSSALTELHHGDEPANVWLSITGALTTDSPMAIAQAASNGEAQH